MAPAHLCKCERACQGERASLAPAQTQLNDSMDPPARPFSVRAGVDAVISRSFNRLGQASK
jgi:hypothetical protein